MPLPARGGLEKLLGVFLPSWLVIWRRRLRAVADPFASRQAKLGYFGRVVAFVVEVQSAAFLHEIDERYGLLKCRM
jgi:hypothetical protein